MRSNTKRRYSTKRYAKTPSLALLVASALVAFVFGMGNIKLHAQSPQSGSSDKPPASATPAASPSAAKPAATPAASTTQAPTTPAKQETTKPKTGGMVWVNTDSGVYHKQGTRWYGKTKHGKYMLEADAIKAGYKPAK